MTIKHPSGTSNMSSFVIFGVPKHPLSPRWRARKEDLDIRGET
jgi:hypothetical protein